MSNAKALAYTLRTPCACPTSQRSRVSSPLALTPRSARASCRCIRASTNAARRTCCDPTWTTLGCGDSTRSSCSALPSSVLFGKYVQAMLCRQHGACGLYSLSISHPGHGRHAKRRLRPPSCCGWGVIGFEVRCTICVQAVDVGLWHAQGQVQHNLYMQSNNPMTSYHALKSTLLSYQLGQSFTSGRGHDPDASESNTNSCR